MRKWRRRRGDEQEGDEQEEGDEEEMRMEKHEGGRVKREKEERSGMHQMYQMYNAPPHASIVHPPDHPHY